MKHEPTTRAAFLSDATSRKAASDIVRNHTGWMTAAAGIAALAGMTLFNRVQARRAEAACPPAGQFVEVDGVSLHYVDRGHGGSTVVLLHGNGVTLQDYEASGLLGLVAERHRVIAFDRPGFGYSQRPRTTLWTPAEQANVILHALRRMEVEKAVVVGHSWSTLVALAMAVQEPALVQGLVLLSGYYYGTARPDLVPISAPAVPLIGDIMAHTLSPLVGRLAGPAAIKASFHPARVSDKFKLFPLEMALRPSQIRATAADTAMMVPAAIELSRRYAEVEVPVVVMAGEGDLITHRDKHSERLVAELKKGELRVVPGQGHLLHYAVPDQVRDAINDIFG